MLIDSVLILLLLWGATRRFDRLQLFVVCGLLALDAAFVVSNLDKVPTGGWFPILFGLAIFGVMKTWQRGRVIVTEKMRREERPVASFLEQLEKEPPLRVEGVAVFPTSNTTGIPRTLVRNLKMNGVLHEHTIIFTLITERVPRVSEGRRSQSPDAGARSVSGHRTHGVHGVSRGSQALADGPAVATGAHG